MLNYFPLSSVWHWLMVSHNLQFTGVRFKYRKYANECQSDIRGNQNSVSFILNTWSETLETLETFSRNFPLHAVTDTAITAVTVMRGWRVSMQSQLFMLFIHFHPNKWLLLGPILCTRLKAWLGSNQNTKTGLHTTNTTHQTNLYTTPGVHMKFRVSI